MKTIEKQSIIDAVKNLCIHSNCIINDKIYNSLKSAIQHETSETSIDILTQLIRNGEIAKRDMIPICQDTGTAVVFVEIGRETYVGGNLGELINEGVRQGYQEGYLRKSIVNDPLNRVNTGDNTPAIIHYDIVEGDNLKITIAPKGGGSENCSKVFMLSPSDGIEGIKKAVIETVIAAGPNPCPPIIVGIGIGGNFEKSTLLAKKALLRDIGDYSELQHIKQLEIQLLEDINKTGIGAQGLGGNTTALFVAIETFACHIASLPLAINIGCHATRHGCIIL